MLKAVADGTVFEVVYGIALRASSTAAALGQAVPKDARRNVIAGARELIRITGGKNVILSSDVARCLEMRAPHDLINLCARFARSSVRSTRCRAQRRRPGLQAGASESGRVRQLPRHHHASACAVSCSLPCLSLDHRTDSNRQGYRGVLSTPRLVTAPAPEEQAGQKRKRDGADVGAREDELLPT